MNLYLIKRTDKINRDEYDSAVVAAETEEQARKIHPKKNYDPNIEGEWYKNQWVDEDSVVVELIGMAKPYTKPGVICASFNAG